MTATVSRFLFVCQRLRLRVERLLLRRTPRVLATACWAFPIYSQTFVYQELTQLVRRGFALRFFYGHLNLDDQLPAQFRPVWRARRRLLLHPAVCDAGFAFFMRRSPLRVEQLLDTLSEASGLPRDEVQNHYHVRQSFAFAWLAEAYRPDYIHSYFFYEGTLFALVASALLGVPRGVSCYADHMLDDYALKLVALNLRQCSIVVATSQRIRDELAGIDPTMPSGHLLVKPNAINTAHFPVVPRTTPAPGAPFRLVSVCRLEPKKGLLELVEAIGQLRDRGHHVELHVIGGVDDSDASRAYAESLRARIAALDLSTRVVLAGRRSEKEINDCFRASHLFVAPFVETSAGDKDGVPTSLLEAMSSGLPIVATDAGSMLEVIEDGRDGVIVPQRDPDALARVIAELMADEPRRAALGAHAADKARRAFDVAACERLFHDRLTTLLAGANLADAERQAFTAT